MDAVIFFDIRNFSSHRQFLAKTRGARPLTTLVQQLLEKAVSLSQSLVREFKLEELPLLNHTGDGFVIVLQNGKSCLAALRFVSEFREFAEKKLARYQREFSKLQKEKEDDRKLPPSVYYGIGVHCGSVTSFKYQSFSTKRTAFLGSAINIASRVEGCTKDHPYPVLCTETVLNHGRKDLGDSEHSNFESFFIPLGPHNLRGLEGPVTLVVCEPGFHRFLDSR